MKISVILMAAGANEREMLFGAKGTKYEHTCCGVLKGRYLYDDQGHEIMEPYVMMPATEEEYFSLLDIATKSSARGVSYSVSNYLRLHGPLRSRQTMTAYCREAKANIPYEMGMHGFLTSYNGYKIYVRLITKPYGDPTEYAIYVYDGAAIDEVDRPKRMTQREVEKKALELGLTSAKPKKAERSKPHDKPDWRAIGELMRETGMTYGQLTVSGKINQIPTIKG